MDLLFFKPPPAPVPMKEKGPTTSELIRRCPRGEPQVVEDLEEDDEEVAIIVVVELVESLMSLSLRQQEQTP